MSKLENRRVLPLKSRALNDVRNFYIQLEELFEKGYRIARNSSFDDRCSVFPHGRVCLYLEGKEPVQEIAEKPKTEVKEVEVKDPEEFKELEPVEEPAKPEVEKVEEKQEEKKASTKRRGRKPKTEN